MNQHSGGFGVLGVGKYVPERVLTNADLEAIVDTTDEWILQRTGISERRIVAEGETTASMAIKAARAALENAGVDGESIGLVIVTTATPDYYSPAMASHVQHALGAKACAAFDLNAACTGSIYGLAIAESYLRSGACEFALVVGAETLTRVTDWTDRRTCILFGDGAGAAVLGRLPEGYGILSSLLRSDGEGLDLITIPGLSISDEDLLRRGGKHGRTIWMDGAKVMK
ncbi:MAG: beta-ketoacyl-ACP synthase 3, partial [Clostridiales bacterium]|nr:beta-ketoacyl-ACP synthase 3 [Clostridiales bacterium]